MCVPLKQKKKTAHKKKTNEKQKKLFRFHFFDRSNHQTRGEDKQIPKQQNNTEKNFNESEKRSLEAGEMKRVKNQRKV